MAPINRPSAVVLCAALLIAQSSAWVQPGALVPRPAIGRCSVRSRNCNVERWRQSRLLVTRSATRSFDGDEQSQMSTDQLWGSNSTSLGVTEFCNEEQITSDFGVTIGATQEHGHGSTVEFHAGNDDDGGKTGNKLGLSDTDRLINLAFLTASFGYAIYTILNIDHGLTRGWTPSEIAMRIPLDNWGNYESALESKPVATKTLINVVIYLLGDWLSQTIFAKEHPLDFDISRTLKNGFIGMCFGPLVSAYYSFSDYILPPEEGLITRIEKICMDQTLYLTVKCSIYIFAVGVLNGSDVETAKESVKDKIAGIVLRAWSFWPLVHCITYGLIPARHRILWVNGVDLIWNAILASAATKTEGEEEGTQVVATEESISDDSIFITNYDSGDGAMNMTSHAALV